MTIVYMPSSVVIRSGRGYWFPPKTGSQGGGADPTLGEIGGSAQGADGYFERSCLVAAALGAFFVKADRGPRASA